MLLKSPTQSAPLLRVMLAEEFPSPGGEDDVDSPKQHAHGGWLVEDVGGRDRLHFRGDIGCGLSVSRDLGKGNRETKDVPHTPLANPRVQHEPSLSGAEQMEM
jgi:hypothetical protein